MCSGLSFHTRNAWERSMMDYRRISTLFWTSEQVVECSPIARLLFLGILSFCDDAGDYPASVKKIRMRVFPGDQITDPEILLLVDELIDNGLLEKYSVDGKAYLHVKEVCYGSRP